MARRGRARVLSASSSGFFVSPTGSDSNPGTQSQPFQTIGAAKTAIRAVTTGMSSDLTVYLRGGRYQLSATTAFTPADSGLNGFRVLWKAFPGETPRVSGGQAITGWSDQGGGLWRASTSLEFRQVYVDGTRAIRGRYPKTGSHGDLVHWNTDDNEIEVDAAHADELALAEEIVIIGTGVNNSILRIASTSGDVLVPEEPERTRLFDQTYPPKGPGTNYFLQGAQSFVTDEGEWHLDTTNNFLYYRPRAGENMATASVYVPQVEALFTLYGTDLDTPVHDIEFHGITFEHGTWMYPSEEGYVGDQGSVAFETTLPVDQISSYPGTRIPAMVDVNVADDIRFERCIFRHGGASGLNLTRGVTDAVVIGNVFHDLSGSGVWADLAMLGNTSDSRIPCRRVTVSNNYITQCGQEYYNCVGIGFAYVDSGIIEHNEVTDLPYLGITVGWGWEDAANTMNGNIVRRNEVWDVCKIESDSGGIYTLSRQANGGSPVDGLIQHNYIHDIVRVTGIQGGFNISALYLDMGTDNIDVLDNVCDVPDADVEVFRNLNGGQCDLSNNDSTDGIGVIAAAGLQAGYEDIRDLVE